VAIPAQSREQNAEARLGSKTEMLAAIRAALGAASGDGGLHAEPGVSATPSPAAPREELVSQFCAELEKVGGHTIQLQNAGQIRDYIEGILGAHASSLPDTPSIAISDGAHQVQPGLRAWIKERGLDLLPSLRESDSIDRDGYKRALFESAMGVSTADFAIADTGTLVLVSERNPQPASDTAPKDTSNGGDQHRLISLVPPVHVCLLDANRILPNLAELITHVNARYYRNGEPPLAMTFITGPSRTADIELTLTMGVHGPRELHVLVYAG
jgi:L-lactate dehydrogenase complex protein LldG